MYTHLLGNCGQATYSTYSTMYLYIIWFSNRFVFFLRSCCIWNDGQIDCWPPVVLSLLDGQLAKTHQRDLQWNGITREAKAIGGPIYELRLYRLPALLFFFYLFFLSFFFCFAFCFVLFCCCWSSDAILLQPSISGCWADDELSIVFLRGRCRGLVIGRVGSSI